MLHLPTRLAALLAALPDFAIAGVALATWIHPPWLGEDKVQWFLGLMLLEFIVVHSSGFLGAIALSTAPRRKRAVGALAMSGFYTLFVLAFAFGLKAWWPLLAFWGLTANRLLGIALGQAPEGRELALVQAGWAAGAVAYVLGAFATVVPPIPQLGIRPEMLGDLSHTGGLWIDEPQRVVAFAALYFTATGIFNLLAHRWVREGSLHVARAPAPQDPRRRSGR